MASPRARHRLSMRSRVLFTKKFGSKPKSSQLVCLNKKRWSTFFFFFLDKGHFYDFHLLPCNPEPTLWWKGLPVVLLLYFEFMGLSDGDGGLPWNGYQDLLYHCPDLKKYSKLFSVRRELLQLLFNPHKQKCMDQRGTGRELLNFLMQPTTATHTCPL